MLKIKTTTLKKNCFLRLHENPIGDEGISILVSGLIHQHLNREDSAKGFVTDDGTREGSPNNLEPDATDDEHPRGRSCIKFLDIGECGMTDVGAKEIAKLIASNIGLETLSLTGNKDVTVEGWSEIGNGLASNSQIETLEIHHNRLGDEGVEALVKGLRSNRSVSKIDLEGNGIGDTGGQRLIELLQHSKQLRTMYVSQGNDMDEDILKQIMDLQEDET